MYMELKEIMQHLVNDGKLTFPGWDLHKYIYLCDNKIMFHNGSIMCTSYLDSPKWQKYTVPVRYSVDIWLNKTPRYDVMGLSLLGYIAGKDRDWNQWETHNCNKKYKITVEEVKE